LRLFVLALTLSACARTPASRTDLGTQADQKLRAQSATKSSSPKSTRDSGLGDAASGAHEPKSQIQLRGGGPRSVSGRLGIVTSVEANATRAGVRILEQGGNAVDAAVAVAYSLAVTHPSAGNIGGGGFMLVKPPHQATVALDFRETAPRALTRELFDRMIAQGGMGPVSIGVPGSVAGLNLAQARFGRLTRNAVLLPAIELARRGHTVSNREANSFRWNWRWLVRDPGARLAFGRAGGKEPLPAGTFLRRSELARTLELIAEQGDPGFYSGPVADAIVTSVQRAGGILTLDDLSRYRAVIRDPLRMAYRGLTVEVMPPPSAGGVAIAQMLFMLERLGAYRLERQSPEQLHLFIEAARRAQAERRFAIFDPDSLSARELAERRANWTNPRYLLDRPPTVDPEHATPSERVHPLYQHTLRELGHTTHFGVVDKDGMVVSCTMTLSAGFGAKRLVVGTGVLLNNSVASFSSAGDNQPVAGRRTTSSMAPTLVLDGQRPLLVLGTPGGDTIPSTIVQLLRNLVDYGMLLEDAVDAPRVHHGFVPDAIRLEPGKGLAPALRRGLERLGHHFLAGRWSMGDANSIVILENNAFGYADPREGGLALAVPANPDAGATGAN
jgi:gamma-glutamyltranspeptidase / glutathione hydrolase